ncbi:unnamed protein product [Adineta steineri]|uniref:Protein quiver n=1 Tax=Adineta steineri TaxID=433720 RepID=A0A815MPN8_9BILA|nr:unnamed protein product [Adineta steineri]CAF3933999.1 unnamed protein product [Adineta steineri]
MQSIFILLLNLGCISIVDTYKCYTCVALGEGHCNDPFNPTGMTDNEKKEALPHEACIKTKSKLMGTIVVGRTVNASASSCPGGRNGCKEESKDGDTTTICCCTSALCNGVSMVQQKPLIVFLTMSTLATLAYRLY